MGWPIGIWPIQPMTEHRLEVRVYTGSNYRYGNSIYVYTPPANPTLIINNIEQTSVQLTIDPNGNPLYPNTCSAYLQRSSDLVNWNNVHDFTTSLTFTDNGLQAGKTYYYRVEIMGKQDPLRKKVYSYQGEKFYIEVQTTDDPAVVAAQKAENAAQLAREAAQQTLQYSLDAKTAAVNAESKANITLQEVQDSTYGLSALRNEILNIKNTINTAPIIYSLKGVNNATATKTSQITLDASVSNATHYRVNNGSWQEYTKQIIVNGLTVGVNRIEIEFGNLNAELQGETVSTALTVFRLP